MIQVNETLLESLHDWASQNVGWLVGGLLLLLLAQTLRLVLAQSLAARRVSRHRKRGEQGESEALVLLKREGFRISGHQVTGSYQYEVDGIASRAHLRADFIVKKRGKSYVAEVKAGVESVKVSGRNTRRQLLESLLAFDVDGVILVDMFEEKIHHVTFPLLD